MFYSQCLLSRKGTLGTIWVAAHCLKRVKKHQVVQTDISSSVDTILLDEVPVVSYRVLGQLLLGVVRIYSKKMEYLFHDCRRVLVRIRDFAGSKKTDVQIEAICEPYLSITRPERFELDAFDLQIREDGSGLNVRPDADIMLADAWNNEGSGHFSFDKYHCEEVAEHFGICSTDQTPAKVVLSPYIMGNDVVASQSHNLSNSEASIEKLRGNNFSLEEHLDPMLLDAVTEEPGLGKPFGEEYQTDMELLKFPDTENDFGTCSTDQTPAKDVLSPYIMGNDAVASQSHNLSNSEASIEKLRGNNFSLEEHLDSMLLDGVTEEPGLGKPFGEEYQTDMELLKFPDTENDFRAEEGPVDPVRSFDEERDMNEDPIKLPEMISPESGNCQNTMKDHSVSITIDVTPPSKCPNTSGATTPEFMVVKTPAAREPTRFSRKRKCLFDGFIVLPNKVVKDSIEDPSDLVCKRRKVPQTALDAWKAHQISNLPQTLLEPLIHCNSFKLRSLCWKKKLKSSEAFEPVESPEKIGSPTVEPAVERVEAPEKIGEVGSPTVEPHRSPDEPVIAPSTPVTCPTSLRSQEVLEITNLDRVGTASSFESIEKQLSPSEDREFDISLINEVTNSCEGESLQTNEWSVRTRTLASYLCKSFLNRKKRRGDAVVNLSQVLKRKTKSESAAVFYEILVLKTGGYIDVKQQAPFDDILVLETPKLQESCEN